MRITVEKSVYDKTVLLKTAYRYTDKAYVHLAQNETQWIIDLSVKENENTDILNFENDLITEQLRLSLVHQTEDIRKITLARAYASTVIENTDEFVESEQKNAPDSAHILEGWFNQHG